MLVGILKAEPRVSHDLMLFSLNTISLSIEEVALSYLSTVDNKFILCSVGKLVSVTVSRILDN